MTESTCARPIDPAARTRSFGPVRLGGVWLHRPGMNADLRRLRFVVCVAGIVATVGLASACGGGGKTQAAPKDSPLMNYSGSYVDFNYPAGWKALRFRRPLELHSFPLVYLSTQAIHSPCSTRGNETTCGWPLRRLQPGGVLAVWQLPYSPPCPGCARGPMGTPVQVGGRRAMRRVAAGGVCRSIGADRTIEVMIKNGVEFMACLRGPNLAQNERRVDALLKSTRFPSQSGPSQSS